jgi:hypothetical protein
MAREHIPTSWSKRFGLAVSPLFEQSEISDAESHYIFLDGGPGTFALTISEEEVWRENTAANWAWSSDIAHHVTLTSDKVAVVRWDRPRDTTLLSRSSVDRNLDDFYKFLTTDRLNSTQSVVYHLLRLFRRIRSLVADAKIPDDKSSEIFLLCLEKLIVGDTEFDPKFSALSDIQDLYESLDSGGLAAALRDAKQNEASFGMLRLYPALAIRHAGGLLFQEAHFELIRAPSLDFFGYIGDPEVQQKGRGGTHFTPPALARSIVEQVLRAIPDLKNRSELRVCDPACGSGVFLHEVLRALRRINFVGRIMLVGRDVSPIAVSMAKFALNCAIRDWQSTGGIELHLDCTDSLSEGAIPKSDIIVMNPPFISWSSQNQVQRSQLTSIVGRSAAAKGDLSMAFVTRGVDALAPGGVLGTLFPASLLSQRAAEDWRTRLTDGAEFTFLGMIGDYGLFTHALVQTGCAVLRRSTHEQKSDVTALVTGNDILATGEALRALRKASILPPPLPTVGDQWGVFALPAEALRRQTWKLRVPAVDAALHKLEELLLPLGKLFDVRQGVQTGDNQALLLNEQEWAALPKRERKYFRLATMSDSIKNGKILKPYYLFFPHSKNGPIFASEREVKDTVPEYYKRYLGPNKSRLAGRATIKAANRSDWWGLMRPRAWSFENEPRLISKYFSGQGGFIVDVKAEYLPSTGFIWVAKSLLARSRPDNFSMTRILYGYAGLFNSSAFGKILQYYAPHVSGGQFDLSPRYVNHVPLPNLSDLLDDPVSGEKIDRLASLAEKKGVAALSDTESEINDIVTDIYGPHIIAAL